MLTDEIIYGASLSLNVDHTETDYRLGHAVQGNAEHILLI